MSPSTAADTTVFTVAARTAPMSLDDIDLGDAVGGSGGNRLETSISGITVSTSLEDVDPETIEALHKRQIEFALEHAEAAKEATRM